MTIRPFTELRPLSLDEGWRLSAECRDEEPELFFPPPGHQPGIDAAKAVCFSCRVRAECLEEGLRGYNRYGVWGGMSEAEREPLLRARTQAAS